MIFKVNCDDLQSKNTELSQQLDQKDVELQDFINGYEDTISSIKNNVYYTLSYYKEDTLLSSELVKHGSTATSLPQSTNDYYISGWALEDGTPIDIATFSPTANTTLYAQTEVRYKITWVIETPLSVSGGSSSYAIAQYLSQTEFEFLTEDNSEFQKKFSDWTIVGWVFSGDFNTIYTAGDQFELPADGWIQFNALLSRDITATYKVDGETIKTDTFTINNVSKLNYLHYATVDLSALETPTKDGYTFKGWAVEGAEDTILTTSKIMNDTTFVAVFEENTAE